MATIRGLIAGRYLITVDGGVAPAMEVTVPSGSVMYKRPVTVGFRVSVRHRGGSIKPLEPGDIITAVNGKSVAVGDINDRISLALAEGSVMLTVVRAAETMEIRLTDNAKGARFVPVASLTR